MTEIPKINLVVPRSTQSLPAVPVVPDVGAIPAREVALEVVGDQRLPVPRLRVLLHPGPHGRIPRHSDPKPWLVNPPRIPEHHARARDVVPREMPDLVGLATPPRVPPVDAFFRERHRVERRGPVVLEAGAVVLPVALVVVRARPRVRDRVLRRHLVRRRPRPHRGLVDPAEARGGLEVAPSEVRVTLEARKQRSEAFLWEGCWAGRKGFAHVGRVENRALGVAGVHPLFAVREEHARRRHPQRGRNFVGREDTVRRKLLRMLVL
mmetsp:Transcript_31980/g.75957  ORF Transcript_31980/g.75957 Transcript_31980/m.75957 type:complete len:265 (-) Transcript_31980:265-1059(-)